MRSPKNRPSDKNRIVDREKAKAGQTKKLYMKKQIISA
jgi:hypothetical protein